MTVQSTTSRAGFIGTDTVGPFAFPFRIMDASDLQVIVRDTDTGVEEELSYPADFSISGVRNRSGGSITLAVALAETQVLSIRRAPSFLQQTDLRNQGSYFPEVLEDALDRITMQVQALRDQINRAPQLPDSYDPGSYDLRLPTPEAGTVIGWNPAGTGLTNLAMTDAQLASWAAAQNQVRDVFLAATPDFIAGTTTTLTLTQEPGSLTNVTILRRTAGETIEYMADEFSLLLDVITFTSPIPTGTTRIEVRYFYTYQINTADAGNVRLNLGEGRLARSLADHLLDNATFNVKDFGAVGDGVTDDREAIQAAVDACLGSDHGGTVYFPAGGYLVGTGSVTVNNFVGGSYKAIHFRGEGILASRLTKATSPTTGDLLVWNCAHTPTSITSMGIVAALGGNLLVDGLTCAPGGMNGVIIRDVWFNGFRNNCRVSGSDNILTGVYSELSLATNFSLDGAGEATGCYSYQSEGNGFKVSYDTWTPTTFAMPTFTLTGCRDTTSKGTGFWVSSRENAHLVGCVSWSTSPLYPSAAFYIDASSGTSLIGVRASSVQRGIVLNGVCAGTNIIAPDLRAIGSAGGGGNAIELGGSTVWTTITDPKITDCYRNGIDTGNSARTRIRGGTIRNYGTGGVPTDRYGIRLRGDAVFKGTEVENTDFDSASGGGAFKFDSGTQGAFNIRRCTGNGVGTEFLFTNAPAGTLSEQNQGRNYGTAAPTYSGTYYLRGERVENTSPALGAAAAWVCTVAGFPGTWVPAAHAYDASAAIDSPAADVAELKTAVDLIRAALIQMGGTSA